MLLLVRQCAQYVRIWFRPKSLCDLCRTVNQCGLKHQNEEAQQVDLQGPD
uniref:Uncharacterized protein n=1 Tax=Anguilla anguilla TaxID=7936 RepID=A0A0E9TM63_ANGAN